MNTKIKYVFFTGIILGVIFSFQLQTFAQQGWQWQYPKPQGNTLNDIFVFNSNTAIAVGDVGTVIKTTDGGNNWDVLHHAGGTEYNLNSVYFIDSLHGWIAGGTLWQAHSPPYEAVLLETFDGGKNWLPVPTDTVLPFTSVYFVDKDTGFVFTEFGWYQRTTDGGKHWKKDVVDSIAYIYDDALDPYAVTFLDKNTGWLVGRGFNCDFFKTTDCGRKWVWKHIAVCGMKDIYFVNKNYGYSVGSGAKFAKTSDGGDTWQCKTVLINGTSYPFYSVCFMDTLTGYITGHNLILKTTDGGETWIEQSVDLTDKWLYKIRFSKDINTKGWMVGRYGSLYRTIDAGNIWSPQRGKKYGFSSSYFLDNKIGWVVGGNGAILCTSDGGINWEDKSDSSNLGFSSVHIFDDKNIIIAGSKKEPWPSNNGKGILLKTTNNGISWSHTIFDTLNTFLSMAFIDDSTGFLTVFLSNILLKTTDRGETWNRIGIDSSIQYLNGKIQFISKTTGWIGASLKTTDSGNNWMKQTLPISPESFYYLNSEMGWVVAENKINKTTDGGISWQTCSNFPLGVRYLSVFFIDVNKGWVTGFDNTRNISRILITKDGGNSWTDQICPVEDYISNIFINENLGWAIGDGIVNTINSGYPQSIKEEEEKDNHQYSFILYQNYPNPFNPTTEIVFKLESIGVVKLKIYDVLGREVTSLLYGELNAGTHKITWNASKFASGVYFYQLQVLYSKQQYIETKKMILIR